MRAVRWAVLASVFVILSSGVSSTSFGSFPVKAEKKSTDLDIEYRIGLINPGGEPLEVKLSAEESEEYNVTFSQKKVTVSPSKTSNPSGSGWYHLGDGEYTRGHEVSFQVDISRYREDNSLEIPVRLEAIASGAGSGGSNSTSRLVQVRTYTYTAEIAPFLRPEDRPEQDTDGSWRESFWQEEQPTADEEDFNLNQSQSSNQEEQNQTRERSLKNQNRSGKEARDSEKSGINQTTLILFAGILVSAGYILMAV